MARRFNSSLHPVHRIKHVIDAEGTVDDTPIVVVPLIDAEDAPTLAGVTTVETGSKVYGIYLHIEVSHTSGTGRPNIYMIVYKNPATAYGGTAFDPKSIGNLDLKRFVIHQEMILMSGDAGNGLPRPLFNGVIKIPKGMQRMGPDDRLAVNLVIGTAGVNADWCLQCHYKEFR